MPAAYPVLELGFEERAARLATFLESFENMYIVGRNARFAYAHLHDLSTMRIGRSLPFVHALSTLNVPPSPRKNAA